MIEMCKDDLMDRRVSIIMSSLLPKTPEVILLFVPADVLRSTIAKIVPPASSSSSLSLSSSYLPARTEIPPLPLSCSAVVVPSTSGMIFEDRRDRISSWGRSKFSSVCAAPSKSTTISCSSAGSILLDLIFCSKEIFCYELYENHAMQRRHIEYSIQEIF